MSEAQERWYAFQAIERLAQHVQFEVNPRERAEQIEMLRGLVLRMGRHLNRNEFGFEARLELQRLGLWDRLADGQG